jgi:hypothetical protein
VYADEVGRQFERKSGVIRETVGTELDLLVQEVMVDARRHMTETESHVREMTLGIIDRNFPELDTPEAKARLVTQVSDIANAAVAEQVIAFEERYAKDMAELRDTIAYLDVQDTGESTAELRRRFLSLWLQIINEELLKP